LGADVALAADVLGHVIIQHLHRAAVRGDRAETESDRESREREGDKDQPCATLHMSTQYTTHDGPHTVKLMGSKHSAVTG
jgi:hypothetical protein